MFKNHHPAYFFTHYLNTFVFSSPTQTQKSDPIESALSFPYAFPRAQLATFSVGYRSGDRKIHRTQRRR